MSGLILDHLISDHLILDQRREWFDFLILDQRREWFGSFGLGLCFGWSFLADGLDLGGWI